MMPWITHIRSDQATGSRRTLYEEFQALYPKEYSTPVMPGGESIMAAHVLLPELMRHSSLAYGEMLRLDLPLDRRQHEMIASWFNYINRMADGLGVGKGPGPA
jgi:hypothetical protein